MVNGDKNDVMVEDLVGQWHKITWSEKEMTVEVARSDDHSNTRSKFLMVGSLTSVSLFNMNAQSRMMERIWGPLKGMEFKCMGENLIIRVLKRP